MLIIPKREDVDFRQDYIANIYFKTKNYIHVENSIITYEKDRSMCET
jgi:hypothetical protein